MGHPLYREEQKKQKKGWATRPSTMARCPVWRIPRLHDARADEGVSCDVQYGLMKTLAMYRNVGYESFFKKA